MNFLNRYFLKSRKFRKHENRRITRENEAIAMRLESKKPHINVKHLENDYRENHLRNKRRLLKLKASSGLLPPIGKPEANDSFRKANVADFVSSTRL